MIENIWKSEDFKKLSPQATNLKDLIAAASAFVQTSGRVVCEVKVNGMVLTEDDESRFAAADLDDVKTLHLRSQEPEALLFESLLGLQDYLGRLIPAIDSTAELFRLDDLTLAHRRCSSLVQGIQTLLEAVGHSKHVFESVRGSVPQKWSDLETDTTEIFKTMLAAYEKKDFILVADLLEYELSPALGQWQIQLVALSELRDHNASEDIIR
jgi:hypothetical protein